MISFDPVKTRQVFMFNANPDEDCDPLIFQRKKVIDDDEDYDPNSYEAVFCLGILMKKKSLLDNTPN